MPACLLTGLPFDAGGVKRQAAHILGAWMLAKACLDTHAPLASPTPTKAAAASLNFDASSDDEQGEEVQHGNDDAMLIDNSFLAKKNLHKDAAAAADESLIRVLESGPSLLEAVKEAVGALKALIPGVMRSFASLLVFPHHACLRCAQPSCFQVKGILPPASLTKPCHLCGLYACMSATVCWSTGWLVRVRWFAVWCTVSHPMPRANTGQVVTDCQVCQQPHSG